MRMIRKQVYVTAEDDAKLKRLARQKHCTEAAIVREGIQLVPEEGGSVREKLRGLGLLVEPPPGPLLDPAETAALQARLEAKLRARETPLRLTDAVLQERDEDYADRY